MPLTSLTVVTVINDDVVTSEIFGRFVSILEQVAMDFDFVLVANALGTDEALKIKTLVSSVPDTTAVFLGEHVHDDLARLVGIEHAVGDYVMFCDMASDNPDAMLPLLAELRIGYDLVIGEIPGARPSRRSFGTQFLFDTYARLYAAMTGTHLERKPTGLRVMSRAAALFLAGKPNAELLVRARSIGPGFPVTSVPLTAEAAVLKRGTVHGHSWSKGVAMLLSASTLPLRGASYAALLGGAVSVLYSLYVFAVYLLKPNVAAGWTTISLQLAVMMFIFSIVLLFIGEYVIQIHSASPPRSRRYLVLRELRSSLSRRSMRLNIVNAEGQFQLGQPAWLTSAGEKPE